MNGGSRKEEHSRGLSWHLLRRSVTSWGGGSPWWAAIMRLIPESSRLRPLERRRGKVGCPTQTSRRCLGRPGRCYRQTTPAAGWAPPGQIRRSPMNPGAAQAPVSGLRQVSLRHRGPAQLACYAGLRNARVVVSGVVGSRARQWRRCSAPDKESSGALEILC